MLLLGLAPAWALSASNVDEQWMEILLDGRKIGHNHTLREHSADGVRTVEHTRYELVRAGVPVHTHSTETSLETTEGVALAFEVHTDLAGSETRLEGRIIEQRDTEVRFEGAAGARQQRSDWVAGALLREGIRLAMREQGLEAGTQYRLDVFLPSRLEVTSMDVSVLGPDPEQQNDDGNALIRVDQNLHLDGQTLRIESYYDQDFTLIRQLQPIMGQVLELRRCDRACALAANDAEAAFSYALLNAPQVLHSEQLQQRLALTLDIDPSLDPGVFPRSSEQGWVLDAELPQRLHLTLDPQGRLDAAPGDEHPQLQQHYLQRSDWIQSDAREIRQLARRAARGGRSPLQRMQLMEGFVRGYISNKNLDVGYASALETLHSREGDCTEHAVLLAALARAQGIPTRIAFGLIYQHRFGEQRNVYVPHAWVQAWVDGRWQSFDASQPQFGSGHIALAYGDGDPWRFHGGMALLGQLSIVAIAAAEHSAAGATP